MRICRLITLAFSLTLLAQSAAAETATSYESLVPDSALATYLSPQNGLRGMYAVADSIDQSLGRVCSEAGRGRLEWMAVQIDIPVTLDPGETHPSAGLWSHRFSVTRCGKTHGYQAGFLASPGQPPKIFPLAPGDTYAGPILQRDALGSVITIDAYKKSGQSVETCTHRQVTDTRIIHLPRAVPRQSELGNKLNDHAVLSASLMLDQAQVDRMAPTIMQFELFWIELWSLRLCDVDVDVPVLFFDNPYTGGISFFGGTGNQN